MPICVHCGAMKATAEMRRSPKGGFICRDKDHCRKRKHEAKT